MPHYFFHVMGGRSLIDNVGLELPDKVAMRREAIRHAGAILSGEDEVEGSDKPWRMYVADENAVTVLTLTFEIDSHGD